MTAARRAHPRLPARPARRRAGVRARSATRGPRPTSSPPSTTRRGTEGRFARPHHPHVVPAAAAPDLAHVPAAAAALPARGRVVRPARLRHRHLVLERVGARRARRPRRRPRLLLPQPVPLRLERARGDAARAATRSCAPALRVLLSRWRQWDWIAAQRVDRYVANSRDHAPSACAATSGATSTVLHPPVETDRFAPASGRRRTTSCSPS